MFVKPFDMSDFVRHMKEIEYSKPQYISVKKKDTIVYEI